MNTKNNPKCCIVEQWWSWTDWEEKVLAESALRSCHIKWLSWQAMQLVLGNSHPSTDPSCEGHLSPLNSVLRQIIPVIQLFQECLRPNVRPHMTVRLSARHWNREIAPALTTHIMGHPHRNAGGPLGRTNAWNEAMTRDSQVLIILVLVNHDLRVTWRIPVNYWRYS